MMIPTAPLRIAANIESLPTMSAPYTMVTGVACPPIKGAARSSASSETSKVRSSVVAVVNGAARQVTQSTNSPLSPFCGLQHLPGLAADEMNSPASIARHGFVKLAPGWVIGSSPTLHLLAGSWAAVSTDRQHKQKRHLPSSRSGPFQRPEHRTHPRQGDRCRHRGQKSSTGRRQLACV